MSGNAISSTGISKRSNPVVRLYHAVKAVKVCRHQNRLFDLACQCDDLLSAMRECSLRTEVGADADENERAVEEIRVRVLGWAELSNTAAFMKQKEIRNGIEECHRKLAACTGRFMVALSMVKKIESQEPEMARLRDHQLLIDMIADLREEVRKRGHLVTSEAPQSRETLPQTQVIELDVQGGVLASLSPRPKSAADYSGRASKVSMDPAIEGTQLVFYIGEWVSDGERVALGRLRDQYPDSQKRFKEWIESFLGIQHQHILYFVGHVTIDNVVYSINSWMENGNIREYIQRNPNVDRVRLLSEAASGVEFLHERNIVHGDLCDKNVLIDRDGKAIVCGFDLFKFSNLAVPRVRWLAPERITTTGVASPTQRADVWSFGLLCLEVFTGEDPYSSYSDIYVPILLVQGTYPEHPGPTGVGLSPKMWDVMRSCWQVDPTKRPLMSEIQSTICGMPPSRYSGSRAGSTAFLKTADRQTDTQAPIGLRRKASELIKRRRFSFSFRRSPSQRTPDRSSSVNDNLSRRNSLNSDYSCISGKTSFSSRRNEFRASEKGSKPSENLTEANLASLSSLSWSSTSGLDKRRQFSFGSKRSQTTFDASPSMNSDSLPPSTPRRSGSSSIVPHGALAISLPLNRSKTMPIKKASKIVAPQPSRSEPLGTILLQNRKWDPVSPVVLDLMEKAATDSESLLQLARDGTVSTGNLEGFVSRVIFGTADSSKDNSFKTTFLTIYQLFVTSERLFNILKRRFETTELNPVTAFSRYSILLFIESWLKKGFADEELNCSSMIKELILSLLDSEAVAGTMEAKAREISSLITDPEYICLRQPKYCTPLRRERAERPEGMTPTDLAAALTVVEGDRFKCITYWDYVNFTRQRSNVRRIEVFNIVHDLVTVLVQTTVLHPDLIEQRVKTYEEWIYTAEACRELNNFSSASAIATALMSPMITALAMTCKSKANEVLYGLAKDLTPADGVYQNTLEKVATKDLIPWLDPHLSALNSSFTHSNSIVEVDEHPLIDFKQFSKVAEQIDTLVQYSPPRVHNTTRPEVLAYVEYSLKSCSGDNPLRVAKERSSNLAGMEQTLLQHRDRMQALGFMWSPRRK